MIAALASLGRPFLWRAGMLAVWLTLVAILGYALSAEKAARKADRAACALTAATARADAASEVARAWHEYAAREAHQRALDEAAAVTHTETLDALRRDRERLQRDLRKALQDDPQLRPDDTGRFHADVLRLLELAGEGRFAPAHPDAGGNAEADPGLVSDAGALRR